MPTLRPTVLSKFDENDELINDFYEIQSTPFKTNLGMCLSNWGLKTGSQDKKLRVVILNHGGIQNVMDNGH